ncbi:hypothetical protein D3C86_1652940 [compost metagenome]
MLLFDFLGARLGDLVHDGARQQLLFSAQAKQDLAVHDVGKPTVFARRHPAQALHFKVVARLVGVARKRFFKLIANESPRRGKAVNLEVFEPHERRPKGLILYDADGLPKWRNTLATGDTFCH